MSERTFFERGEDDASKILLLIAEYSEFLNESDKERMLEIRSPEVAKEFLIITLATKGIDAQEYMAKHGLLVKSELNQHEGE